MFDTLVASGNGIGLAAPQVGINKRIVVIDLKEDGKSNPMTLVNPKILSSSPERLIMRRDVYLSRDIMRMLKGRLK